jgi:hypothetical protein
MTHPTLLQINTTVALGELGRARRRPATLDDLPDHLLDAYAAAGVEWLYLLGVWQPGAASREVSRTHPIIRAELERELPDLRDEDIVASPFAVREYRVRREWGGEPALARLRKRLAQRGVKLMLDYVVNHVALDHPWAAEHREYFVRDERGELVNGREPYFAPWPDVLQLDYRSPALREAMTRELVRVAELCDGLRCDMAMLVQPDVFDRTWRGAPPPADGTAETPGPFWRGAIARVRERRAGFTFLAEVYWDREWELQQEGFDFTYDKRLYDRLRAGAGRPVREHLLADLGFQARSTRFLENHDEPRAAAAFPPDVHRAAAVIAFLVPGLRFFHEGQREGRRAHVSMHLARRPAEPVDRELAAFYDRLLPLCARPEVQGGHWHLCPCRAAWDGNPTADDMIAFTWTLGERRLVVCVNYAPVEGQCYVTLEQPGLRGRSFMLVDLLGDARYPRDGDGLAASGLYLDMLPWGVHAFEVAPRT